MQRFIVLLLLFVLILAFVLPTLAQDNKEDTRDPFTPADNECYDGGTLEGKCNTTDVNGDYVVDQRDTDWMWTCGWYLARFNDGHMRRLEVPEDCRIMMGIPHTPPQTVDRRFECILAFNRAYRECIKGRVLKEDAGNDGSFERRWYIASDSKVGEGGVCPGGTTYVADVSSRTGDRAFLRWLQNKGYTLTDDFCDVPY